MDKTVKEWLQGIPMPEEIATNEDGSKYIEITKLEDLLDKMEWSTRNFNYFIFKNSYGDNHIAASIELVLKHNETVAVNTGTIYQEFRDIQIERTFVGACNFSMKSLYPNTHFLATAKSLCIKNAASDAGRRLGRGLNIEVVPSEEKKKEADDGIALLNSVDEIKK